MKTIELQALEKKFKESTTYALKSMTATLSLQQMIGVIGPDGAGKTTLLRLLADLLLPTSGSIKIPQGLSLGYMPQRFGLYEDLSVLRNLRLYADLHSVPQKEIQTRIDKLLNFTSLTRFQDHLAGNLSGGMKQKLGLACVLIGEPNILLLDEPTVGLDPIARRELWQMMLQLTKEGNSVIWSTSALDEAEKCHSILLLNEGELLFQGNPLEFAERVKGRVFKIISPPNLRQTLMQLFAEKKIIDGTIQGFDIRLVLAPGQAFNDFPLVPEKPNFENAFMDRLGGFTPPKALAFSPTPSKKEILSAKSIVKTFGDFQAVKSISFTVEQGEIFGLIGPNGSGKSTTFKMLCGLSKPTSGEILVNGFNPFKDGLKARSLIGYMSQKFSLYDDLTLNQNLEFFAGIYGLSGKNQQKAIEDCIELFHLHPYRKQLISSLPLGFKQRLALACATLHRPRILFLDEPTSGVDPITRREFWHHIYSLVCSGVTILVSTHFLEEAEYCDHVAFIYQGSLIYYNRPDQLKRDVTSIDLPSPTMEDAFIQLVERHGK